MILKRFCRYLLLKKEIRYLKVNIDLFRMFFDFKIKMMNRYYLYLNKE
jgi:hypothetical protein